jgi:diguanylate cyclase (GGDEF)-like protein
MTGTYSFELVGLSILVAVCASYVAFALASHISESRGWAAVYWLTGGAVAMGTGIWSMHFIGMLAYHLPIAVAYGLEATLASLAIAVAVSGFALYVIANGDYSRRTLWLAAIAMGGGIAMMHYVGVAAMEVAPRPTYSAGLVILSVLLAIAASALALALAFNLRIGTQPHIVSKRLVAAIAMGLGIVGMHYTAMAAVQFAPGTICTLPGLQVDQFWVALITAALTLLFLGATMLVLTIDVRLIHELDDANAQITALARQDPLTGLANRRTFLEQLEAVFASRSTERTSLAVLFLDLDGFKDINDTLGHAAGDKLLIEIANRIRATVRRDDVVARFGGDEFAILQQGVQGADDAGTLAEKIREAISAPVDIGNEQIAVTSSIGVVQVSEDTGTPADLMVQADLALYRAKDDGRNRYCFHNSDLDRQVHTRVLMARELRLALERGELELTYQPQVEIASGRIVGLEVGSVWNHPSRGIIKPSVFIPIAERTGTSLAIGTWMIDEAFHQMRQWQDHDIAPTLLAIDISRGQFKASANLTEDLNAALERHGIAASSIELELDESVLMRTAERHLETFQDLRRAGFRITLNEFGAGNISLSALTRQPVDRLKIASALIGSATTDEASAAAVRIVAQMGAELGATVIADGVHTQAQAMFLVATGCSQAQGSFFAPRLAASEATLLLRSQARPPAARGQKLGRTGPTAA